MINSRGELFDFFYDAFLINYHMFPFVLGICSYLMYYYFGFYPLDFDKGANRDSKCSSAGTDQLSESFRTTNTGFNASIISSRHNIL